MIAYGIASIFCEKTAIFRAFWARGAFFYSFPPQFGQNSASSFTAAPHCGQ